MKTFDVIVVGVGGMGSAALYYLARRGFNVLGVDQYHLAHDQGSSHGQTRIIRKAYFEHPDYVPLLHRAYDLWQELEHVSGQELFCRTGLLLIGPPDGHIIAGAKKSAREHHLDVQSVTGQEMASRFGCFRFRGDAEALFETDAGFLRVEACVQAYADQAAALGANIITHTAVESWTADESGVRVKTSQGDYLASSLVICAGAWAGQVLADLRLPLQVRRKVVCWFQPSDSSYDLQRGCPVFGFDTPDGFFYGFPAVDDRGVKLANHTGGQNIERPQLLDRDLHQNDVEPLEDFIAKYLHQVRPAVKAYSVCMYTMTPDEHFIIDRHPNFSNVFFAAGFSGHGFKFAPVVGSVLADFIVDGQTREPIAFLSLTRSALRNKPPG